MMAERSRKIIAFIGLVLGWVAVLIFGYLVRFDSDNYFEQAKESILMKKRPWFYEEAFFEYRIKARLQLLEHPKYIWWLRSGLMIFNVNLFVITLGLTQLK